MDTSVILLALFWGLVSACSLPLGTLTTLIWTPGDRVLAVLMAFGGGALLAALTIDLVASALGEGHVHSLTLGCVLGGLLFVFLNQTINNQGGFLRKSSTMIGYLRRRRRHRLTRLLGHMEHLDALDDLPTDDLEDLACAARMRQVPEGVTLFFKGEPADSFYFVESGEVRLIDGERGGAVVRAIGPSAAFGHASLFTGTRRSASAITTAESRIWRIPKRAVDHRVVTSPTFARAVRDYLMGESVTAFLTGAIGIDADAVADWRDRAAVSLDRGGPVPPAQDSPRGAAEFPRMAGHIGRFPIFQRLLREELEAIAERLLPIRLNPGDTLFHRHDPADRFYIVEHGEVTLIDPLNRDRPQVAVHDHEALGGMSFLTGARHSVSAVATAGSALWSLERDDFEDLLLRFPHLDDQVRDFLRRGEVADYLETRQHFDPHKAARWIRHATRNLAEGRLIPAASELAGEVGRHGGAPLAIWLGILLDGIPESLVIGAGQSHSQLSLSLIAGLFLSNYPEALSSSVGMRHQGMAFRRVLLMWGSLMLITGLGAALGALFLAGAPPHVFALVQGMAAGAMLTMIAETMLPEAYLKGGALVGFSTLLGFLTAIWSSTL